MNDVQVITTELKDNQLDAIQKCRIVRDNVVRTLESAWGAGQALHLVKDQMAHGDFTPWLEANCSVSHSTANSWMQISKHYSREEIREETLLGKSLRGVLQHIKVGAGPKPGPRPKAFGRRTVPAPAPAVNVRGEPVRKAQPTPGAVIDVELQEQLNAERQRADDAEERAAIVDDPDTEAKVKDLQDRVKRFEGERNDAVRANKMLRDRLSRLRRDIAKGVPHDQLLEDHWMMERTDNGEDE